MLWPVEIIKEIICRTLVCWLRMFGMLIAGTDVLTALCMLNYYFWLYLILCFFFDFHDHFLIFLNFYFYFLFFLVTVFSQTWDTALCPKLVSGWVVSLKCGRVDSHHGLVPALEGAGWEYFLFTIVVFVYNLHKGWVHLVLKHMCVKRCKNKFCECHLVKALPESLLA